MKSFLKTHSLKIFLYFVLGNTVLYVLLLVSDTIFSALMHLSSTHNSPWHLYQTWHHYHNDPQIFPKLIFSMIAPLGLIGVGVALYFQNRIPSIYGNAHFATHGEARRAGLFTTQGILLGKKWGRYLCIGGHEHVMVFAPSGSGKTRGISIPNLLTWQDSLICNDIKLELYNTTSQFRQKYGQQCYLWNPGSQEGKTHRYNPLDLIKKDSNTRIDDAQKIASIFIPDNPRTDPIWYTLPRTLFVALILYVLDTPEIPKTIGAIIRLVKSSPNFIDFLLDILSTRTDLDPVCRNNFHLFLQLPEKTQGSILAAFLSHFELFDNDLIDQATSASDFDIRNLRKQRMTIYVGISNDNLVRLAPLISVFYQQVIDVMTRNEPNKDEPYSVLFLMDEFAALRKMESFEKIWDCFVRIIYAYSSLFKIFHS
jgi:type IV secretion system protein VirD4